MKKIIIHVPNNKLDVAIKHISKLRFAKIQKQKILKPINLTRRQKQVLKLLMQGLSNSAVAQILKISIRTVDCHRQTLLLKSQAKNTLGLVRYAFKHDFIKL